MQVTDSFDLEGYSKAIAAIIDHTGPSVVAVKSAAYRVTSGVAFRENLIAVNNHVLKREGPIPVHLPEGREVEASILGRDPEVDLAVLSLREGSVPPLEIEEEPELRAGALAIAVGRTIDSGLSASVGILGAVSSKRRTWRGGELYRFLRLDINLYPSQSGAAVVSAKGKFVGMATPAMLRHAALAVPIESLNRVADELLREGRVRRGFLGVGLQPVAIPEHLRSKSPRVADVGLMVLSVEPGSGAERAGLQLGDILTAIGEVLLTTPEILMGELRGDAVGRPAQLTIIRAGDVSQAEVLVSDRSSKRS